MQSIIDAIKSDPVYGIFVIAAALVLVVTLVKRLLKLALLVGVALGGYMLYLHHTGQRIPATAADVKDTLRDGADSAKEKLEDVFRRQAGKALERKPPREED